MNRGNAHDVADNVCSVKGHNIVEAMNSSNTYCVWCGLTREEIRTLNKKVPAEA